MTWRRARRIAWALRTVTDWHDERNKCSAIQAKCPLGLLENPDAKKLNNAGYLASSWKPDARTHGESYTAQMGSQRGVLYRQMEARGCECDEVETTQR